MRAMKCFSLVALAALTLVGLSTDARSQRPVHSVELQGDVKDQQGALVVGAQITLTSEKGLARATNTDGQGRFHFVGLSIGKYVLQVKAASFAAYETPQNVTANSTPVYLSITLYAGTISEAVTVGSDSRSNLDTAQAAGTQVLSTPEIEALPDDPTQLKDQLQMLATSSGSAPGGATVTVDGFLSGGALPPKSAIRQIRINPDLFSAEYDTPPYRGGRIEILTKPGAEALHGSGFFNFNNSALNARNAFALARAPSQTERYGGQIGGPIVRRRAGFFLDFERRNISEERTVNALVLNENLQPATLNASVLVPLRLLIGSARADWQIDTANTLMARYDFNSNRMRNQGVGGFNLTDRATDDNLSEGSLRFSLTSIVNQKMLNELRVGLTRQTLSEQARSNGPAITVLGAFGAGGASAQFIDHYEQRWEIVDNLTLTAGPHSLKFGVQIYDKSVRDLRSDNTKGTFIFGGALASPLPGTETGVNAGDSSTLVYISGLEQYRRALLGLPGGVPTRFTLTLGSPRVSVNQLLFAGFVQDQWRVLPQLSLDLGLRYEAQTNPLDKMSLAPRVGVAWAPDKKQQWVLRARAGIFYDRMEESLALDALRLDGVRQQQILIDAPSFPDPFLHGSQLNSVSTVRRPLTALRPTSALQMRLEVERQLPRGWKVSASHTWSRGWDSLLTRNINAPIVADGGNPLLAPRPLGAAQNILQFESSGRMAGRVLFIGLFQPTNKRFTLASGYLNFDFRSNADTPFMLPQSSYSASGEWARPDWMSRHILFLYGTVNLPSKWRASLSLNAASGRPFNVTTGRDNNGDGAFNDRPGLVGSQNPNAILTKFGALDPTAVNGSFPRNAGTNPTNITLDFNLARTFAIGRGTANKESRYKWTLNTRASNLLNRTNLLGVNGVLASPFFGRANEAAPARRIEIGLRVSF